MPTASEMDAGQAAFALCELEWMRTRVLVQMSCVELSEFADAMASGVAEAGPELVERVRVAVDEVEALVTSFVDSVGTLPSKGVLATSDEVAAAARSALEEGIVDSERALHAAHWIDAEAGVGRAREIADDERLVSLLGGAGRALHRGVPRR